MHTQHRTVPLQLLVSLAISLSILLLSILLLYQAFRGIEANIMAATRGTAGYVANAANHTLRASMQPALITLRLLSHSGIDKEKNLEERLQMVPLFAEVLRSNPICSAVFVAHLSGEFFLLRDISYLPRPLPFQVPDQTFFIMEARLPNKRGGFYIRKHYYDNDLKLLEVKISSDSGLAPQTRPWFNADVQPAQVITSAPYLFASTSETGLTLTELTHTQDAIIGVDITISDLNTLLDTLRITPHSELAIIDTTERLVAYSGSKPPSLSEHTLQLPKLAALNIPILNQIVASQPLNNVLRPYQSDGTDWYGIRMSINPLSSNELFVLIAMPAHELLADAWSNIAKQGLTAAIIILLVLLGGWRLGKHIADPLAKLTEQIKDFGQFNFSTSIGVQTNIAEVRELGAVLANMGTAISNLLSISLTLNKETDLENMLHSVLHQLLNIVQQPKGSIFLYEEGEGVLKVAASQGKNIITSVPLVTAEISDAELLAALKPYFPGQDFLTPLRNRDKELVGLLRVACDSPNSPQAQEAFQAFLDTLSGSASIAIETRQLIEAQKALLDGIVKLIADTIDSKSHHTGRHCQRVPKLALLILEHIKKAPVPPFPDFTINEIQEEAFRIAAWLHDCGKLTTPEFVVDKATKLETLYNRIHEVRTRFEILHRDASIQCLQAIIAGESPASAYERCNKEQQTLIDEFTFLASCNIGEESMPPDYIEKIQKIGQRTWLRYFDDRLGLSRDELERYGSFPQTKLPAKERLLADKPSQLIKWTEETTPPVAPTDPRNVWGFNMHLPDYMYNHGELHNLCIKQGTLTPEERFKINEHIVQTICMLSSLPLPKAFRHVPDIAGNHHETLDGKGYPRKVKGSEFSIPEKIMVLADVFEALTASDRPYKEAKSLSEAISILAKMVKRNHIDPELFNFFLTSGAYLDYAHAYLSPSQIDEVSIDELLIPTHAPG